MHTKGQSDNNINKEKEKAIKVKSNKSVYPVRDGERERDK